MSSPDVGALLGLVIASSAQQNVLTTFQDAATLERVLAAAKKSGKLDVSIMAKDGSLQPVVEAAERSLTLLRKMLSDKAQGPVAITFLESL